jgi:hypothetical protein
MPRSSASRCFAALTATLLIVAFANRASAQAAQSAYSSGRAHSLMTSAVVARLKKLVAASTGNRDVVAKVGDSNTANANYLGCFARGNVDLAGYSNLETTRRFFAKHLVDGLHSSFDRTSESAKIGWLAGSVLLGANAPVDREIATLKPMFAVVMLGTNDNRPGGFDEFKKNIELVTDRLLAQGVIPLLSTVPPRDDTTYAQARVAPENAVIRSLAEARQVPLMDLDGALSSLPNHGLVADKIHLASLWDNGAPRACVFTSQGLTHGMNVRNLLTLQALDRARRFVLENETPESDPTLGKTGA